MFVVLSILPHEAKDMLCCL